MKNRKKIVEVIYSFEMGGSERLACAIAETMLNKGCDVKVIALYTNDGPIKEQLTKANIEAIGLDLGKSNFLCSLWKIFRLFFREKPDVVHAHHVAQFVKIYFPARIASVKRIVLTEHASYSLTIKPRLRMLARIFSRRADMVTTVFKGLEELFKKDFSVKSEKLVTIPNGVDVDEYAIKPVEKWDDGLVFNIACVGRLVEAKDHENLIKAMRYIVDAGETNIKASIIGDGLLREHIEKLIKEYNLSQFIEILGNRNDIEELLHSHDILVLSSKREGFPMVILEAMSCGIPCVATKVGGVPDVISPSNGWLVEKEDHVALADGILEAYRNHKVLPEMGKSAREIVINNYDIRNVLKMYEKVF